MEMEGGWVCSRLDYLRLNDGVGGGLHVNELANGWMDG